MYKTVLLALDGSPLAEQAMPHAIALARAFEAAIELVTVAPALDGSALLAAGVSLNWEQEIAQCEEYQAEVVRRLKKEGLTCRTEVRGGEIAEEILRHCQEKSADLIIMTTHGRSGLGRWVYGSVADRVLRYADVPVLLVRARAE